MIEKDLCYDLIGACFEVHKELGCGFLEGGIPRSFEKRVYFKRNSF